MTTNKQEKKKLKIYAATYPCMAVALVIAVTLRCARGQTVATNV